MVSIAALTPKEKPRVMDLLSQAGVDVSDWANFNGGPEKAASNPKYCYEWAFLEVGRTAVLNIWMDSLTEEQGTIQCHLNMRKVAKKYKAIPEKSLLASRAMKMDEILSAAAQEELPLRVILGERDTAEQTGEGGSSSVKKRSLDSEPWSFSYYDSNTGDCLIVRNGGEGGTSPSQFQVGELVAAFGSIKLTEPESKLLNEIYGSPNHEANARVLAQQRLNYKSLGSANLVIGRIAKKVLEALSASPAESETKGREHYLLVLVDRLQRDDLIIWRMKPEVARALEICQIVDPAVDWEPQTDEEQPDVRETFTEGGRKLVSVNVYERSSKAKKACIAKHGLACSVCGFEFEKVYGERGKGFIHVHHLVPISEVQGVYEIDPVKDLRPVCPNCHAMLHAKREVLSIEELKEVIKEQ